MMVHPNAIQSPYVTYLRKYRIIQPSLPHLVVFSVINPPKLYSLRGVKYIPQTIFSAVHHLQKNSLNQALPVETVPNFKHYFLDTGAKGNPTTKGSLFLNY